MATLQLVGKTVILLGAGASYASAHQLPTMTAFFDDPDLPPQLDHFLKWYYDNDKRRAWNLEEVLTHFHLSEARAPTWIGFPRGALEEDQGVTFEALLRYVVARLTPKVSTPCPLHCSLFDEMSPRSSVVTLNYDLVADQALHRHPSVTPELREEGHLTRVDRLWRLLGYAGPSIEGVSIFALGKKIFPPGFYLKLHGSINWLRCSNDSCQGGYKTPDEPDAWQSPDADDASCEVCGAVLHNVIVPPVVAKSSSIRGRLQKMWTTALRQFATATRVIVWGVSFAPSDADLRWLLRFSSQRRQPGNQLEVHVINPDQHACSEAFRSLAPAAPRYRWDRIEDYLAWRKAPDRDAERDLRAMHHSAGGEYPEEGPKAN